MNNTKDYIVAFGRYWSEETAKIRGDHKITTPKPEVGKVTKDKPGTIPLVTYKVTREKKKVVAEVPEIGSTIETEKNQTNQQIVTEKEIESNGEEREVKKLIYANRDYPWSEYESAFKIIYESNEHVFDLIRHSLIWRPLNLDIEPSANIESGTLNIKFKSQIINFTHIDGTVFGELVPLFYEWTTNSYNVLVFNSLSRKKKDQIKAMIDRSYYFEGDVQRIEQYFNALDGASNLHLNYNGIFNAFFTEEEMSENAEIETIAKIISLTGDHLFDYIQFSWKKHSYSQLDGQRPTEEKDNTHRLPDKKNGFLFVHNLFKKYCKLNFYKKINSKKSLERYFKDNQSAEVKEGIKNLNALLSNYNERSSEKYGDLFKDYTFETGNSIPYIDEISVKAYELLKDSIIFTKNKEIFIFTGNVVEPALCLKVQRENSNSFINFKAVPAIIVRPDSEYNSSVEETSGLGNHAWIFYTEEEGSGIRNYKGAYPDDRKINDRGYASIILGLNDVGGGKLVSIPTRRDRTLSIERDEVYCNKVAANGLGSNIISEAQFDTMRLGIKAINLNKRIPSFTMFTNMTKEDMDAFGRDSYEEYQVCKDFLILDDIEYVFRFSEKELLPEESNKVTNSSYETQLSIEFKKE